MSKNKRKTYNALERFCKQQYNKYGEWVDGQFITYDDMEEIW